MAGGLVAADATSNDHDAFIKFSITGEE